MLQALWYNTCCVWQAICNGARVCLGLSGNPCAPQFPRNRRRLDGRDNRCKRCTARMVAERLKQREPITAPTGPLPGLRRQDQGPYGTGVGSCIARSRPCYEVCR